MTPNHDLSAFVKPHKLIQDYRDRRNDELRRSIEKPILKLMLSHKSKEADSETTR